MWVRRSGIFCVALGMVLGATGMAAPHHDATPRPGREDDGFTQSLHDSLERIGRNSYLAQLADLNEDLIPDSLERRPFDEFNVEWRHGAERASPDLVALVVAPRIAVVGDSLQIFVIRRSGDVPDTISVIDRLGRTMAALSADRAGAHQWAGWRVPPGITGRLMIAVRTPRSIYRAAVRIAE